MDTHSTLIDVQPPAHNSHHHHHTGRRIRQFLHPNGKKIHIAGSPSEAEQLRRALSSTEKDGTFDLVIHGSPEHIEALKHTHAHHEERQKRLREQHGHLAQEFENVITSLDELGRELHFVSEHAVQLDANFSKYGYSAHLRTKDSPETSRTTSINNDHDHTFDKETWTTTRTNGTNIPLYQTPLIRQYFHKGLLWRAPHAQQVASYELFTDLFYVGIIAISGDAAAEAASSTSLLHFSIVFILGWKFWSDVGMLVMWVDCDDVLRRFTVLFVLSCLLGFTTNIAAAWSGTYTSLIGFYLAARGFVALSLCWYAWRIPMVRGAMVVNAVLIAVSAGLWIASIHVEEPRRQGLVWSGIGLDLFGQMGAALLQYYCSGDWMTGRFARWVKRRLEFYPGTNIEHRIERTGAFVTLVFGYSVIGLLFQSGVPFGVNAFFGKAVLGLIQAFTFNWLYFEIDSFNLHTHAIRRHVFSALTWFSIHLPFIMSFVLSASALNKIVLAHDLPDADEHALYETYALRSEDHISTGQRWFYCVGLGIALASMGIISKTHAYKTPPNKRIRKSTLVLIRFLASLAIILLPLAGHHLNSLNLIATTCGIVLFVLFLELFGNTSLGDNIWLDSCDARKKCTYSAKCGVTKRELDASVKNGTVINVEEIARREGGEKGGVGVV